MKTGKVSSQYDSKKVVIGKRKIGKVRTACVSKKEVKGKDKD